MQCIFYQNTFYFNLKCITVGCFLILSVSIFIFQYNLRSKTNLLTALCVEHTPPTDVIMKATSCTTAGNKETNWESASKIPQVKFINFRPHIG